MIWQYECDQKIEMTESEHVAYQEFLRQYQQTHDDEVTKAKMESRKEYPTDAPSHQARTARVFKLKSCLSFDIRRYVASTEARLVFERPPQKR